MKVKPSEAVFDEGCASECADLSHDTGSSSGSSSSHFSYGPFDESCFTGSYSSDEHNGISDTGEASSESSSLSSEIERENEEQIDRAAVYQTATLKNLAAVLESQALALEKAGHLEEAARFRIYASQKLSNACTRILKG